MPTALEHMPKYPIYIISKGRFQYNMTPQTLDYYGVPYYVAVEPQEYDDYCRTLKNPDCVLKLPFSNHGMGSGPARNWCWEHAKASGAKRHWILDDNIREFWRFYKNTRLKVSTGGIFRAMEDFVDRFTNVGLAMPQYKWFVPENYQHPAFITNTRCMSCILIDNSLDMRWRGKWNEDVDLSLRVLKQGLCTIIFYAFLQGKMGTQLMKGGNTQEIYGDGTFEKSKMLANLHPDVVKLAQRFGRWHHVVDTSPFAKNKLIPVPGLVIPKEPNEYGMKLVKGYDPLTDSYTKEMTEEDLKCLKY